MPTNPEIAYVGLGSNMEDPVWHVVSSIGEMAEPGITEILSRSSLYKSAPIGFSDQPDFVNCVISLRTRHNPVDLLTRLQTIENNHGRIRSIPNGPRTLDLDLLLYGCAVMDLDRLKLPHPRLHEREFVLRPLLEIAPNVWIPGYGSGNECLSRCSNQGVTQLARSEISGAQPLSATACKD